MSSIFRVFPDARALLSLHPEDLAYHFLPYFRSLPWQIRSGVLSCVSISVQRYPQEVRAPLLDALMAAWDFLHQEGMLGAAERPQLTVLHWCLSIATSSVVTPAGTTTHTSG